VQRQAHQKSGRKSRCETHLTSYLHNRTKRLLRPPLPGPLEYLLRRTAPAQKLRRNGLAATLVHLAQLPEQFPCLRISIQLGLQQPLLAGGDLAVKVLAHDYLKHFLCHTHVSRTLSFVCLPAT
jgi:hypothetical protein